MVCILWFCFCFISGPSKGVNSSKQFKLVCEVPKCLPGGSIKAAVYLEILQLATRETGRWIDLDLNLNSVISLVILRVNQSEFKLLQNENHLCLIT